ncbi:glycoside hydrolase family 10 protein [Streptomyces griseorubiginosus]|uniref:glycoside hydrolase family 10 protein n=1 Tax=Streptomyces griseorubiginosus TaxID=67304 RepID=UPI002E7FF3AE|nr:family 10 glycosylhydrolase [Streptomyces griseorubiginosus]WUB48345.1 family 10 glycosylhydrolase [Streptomyces griseorubiginosus]WUB56871.1 family 10 glycosylhydrolase [Streptomyces griseorubiginosus]
MGHLSRRAFALAALSTLTSASGAAAAPAPRRPWRRTGEMRGVWLATVSNRDWPSRPGLSAAQQRDELLAHLDRAAADRLNTVIFQVRPTADALWPSPHEPWSQYLTGTQGKNPGWDPLGTAVTEAHKRGLQLHAWFNPYRIANHTDPTKLVASHPARLHPDWVVPYGGKLYYNPGLPQVRAFVEGAILDAVRKYPVDAVHFDDYFYPYPVAGQTFDDDAAYDRYGGDFVNRGDWRRDNIDKLVRETAAAVKRIRPTAQFGISPFGVWRNMATDPLGSDTRAGVQSYDDNFADTRKWVRQGWIDYLVPQLYWNIGFAAADYAKLLPWWAEQARGSRTKLYLGEALYKAGDPAQPAAWQDPAELSRHLTLARQYPQARGHVFFAAREVAADPVGAMARVVADHYRKPSAPPRGITGRSAGSGA